MLRFLERRHSPIVLDVAGTGVVGCEGVDDVAVEHGKHLRQIASAAFNLQIRAVVILGIDAEIPGGAGHDLRQTKSPDRRPRADGEPAFLPN